MDSAILRIVEAKMNDALQAYTLGGQSPLRKDLVEELTKATTEFLEVRSHLFRGCGPTWLKS